MVKETIKFNNKSILITGGAGSIGSNLADKLANSNVKQLILVDINENSLYLTYRKLNSKYNIDIIPIILNIRDKKRLNKILLRYNPDIIIHTAALKQVPILEKNAEEAYKTNIKGTLNLLKSSTKINLEYFIYISTDKAVNPTNVMGATKRIGEIIVHQFKINSKKIAVRLGNVYDSSGSVVPIFQQQINSGGPITITHEKAKRFFISKSKATNLILNVIKMGENNELFVLNMGKQKYIKELAKKVCKENGLKLEKDIDIEYIGLREGEKLKEELFYEEEKIKMKKNESISSLKQIETKINIYEKLKEIDKLLLNSKIENDKFKNIIFELVDKCNNNLNDQEKYISKSI